MAAVQNDFQSLRLRGGSWKPVDLSSCVYVWISSNAIKSLEAGRDSRAVGMSVKRTTSNEIEGYLTKWRDAKAAHHVHPGIGQFPVASQAER